MRRKIKHTKRYKDYPKNVPHKLLKKFFALNCSVSKLATFCAVNSGTISNLLNDGIEPKQNNIRVRLGLSRFPICETCGRKIIVRTKQAVQRSSPEFLKEWRHLETTERHKVIQQYLDWKKEIRKV